MKSIKNRLFCVCSFAALLMAPVGLFANDIAVTGEDNGKTVYLHSGDTLNISLAGNMTTGYTWEIVPPLPSTVELVGREYVPIRPVLPGSAGVFIFKVRAVSAGSSVITLAYARCWEKKIPPVQTFSVSLVIE